MMLPENVNELITSWVLIHGLRIAGILIGAIIIYQFGHLIIEKIIGQTIRSGRYLTKEAEEKREKTLTNVIGAVSKIAIIVIAGIMILSEVGVQTAPLIAGAGIVGVALGFGGQYLIKDFITGFFIILENQYRVGDVVCLDKTCGLVENINLRVTILRDLDGTVHHIPNGEIKIASNLTKDFARVNLNVSISYDTNLDKVIKIINNVGNKLAKDKEYKDIITKPPQFLRVDNFGEYAMEIKILGETQPLKQWSVTGELRKRIKEAFEKEKITIPLPQRVIHQQKN